MVQTSPASTDVCVCDKCEKPTSDELTEIDGEAVCEECREAMNDDDEDLETFHCPKCDQTFKSIDGEECEHCGYCPRLDGPVEDDDDEESVSNQPEVDEWIAERTTELPTVVKEWIDGLCAEGRAKVLEILERRVLELKKQ